jgi:O-methyltransferase
MSLGPVNDHQQLFERLVNEGLPDGNVAEFGVYNGGSTRQLAALCPNRVVWAFDTYEGIPPLDYQEALDFQNPPGKFIPHKRVEDLFEGFPNIVPVRGRFVETLSYFSDPVALVYVDCDLYESYRQVLGALPRFAVDGAKVVLDDYGNVEGATKATDEWLLTQPQLTLVRADKLFVWHPQQP